MTKKEATIEAFDVREFTLLSRQISTLKRRDVSEVVLSTNDIILLSEYQFVNDWEREFLLSIIYQYTLSKKQKEKKALILTRYAEEISTAYTVWVKSNEA
ncbi:MAG: hypothetical protein ACTSWQ_00800 [Candidatus Thorarchaeota archaeon]